MMDKLTFGVRRPAEAQVNAGFKTSQPGFAALSIVAPSFNGRTAASGAAYRGSNP